MKLINSVDQSCAWEDYRRLAAPDTKSPDFYEMRNFKSETHNSPS